jgi:hypothetical protein
MGVLEDHMTQTVARPYGTYFCRLRGSAQGIKLRAWTRAQAKTKFAAHEGLDPKNSYIIVSDTPAQGVLFIELRTE